MNIEGNSQNLLEKGVGSRTIYRERFCAGESWFAIQAKAFREELAAASVAKLGIEIFLPKAKAALNVCGTLRLVIKPLFPGYFFARLSTLLHEAVRNTQGVLRIVGTTRCPIPVEESVVEAIRTRIAEDGFVRLVRPAFQPGDRVCIEKGPWQGTIARFEQEWDDGRRVTILLEAIHHARVLVERDCLSLVG